jgi:hypothetical protein
MSSKRGQRRRQERRRQQQRERQHIDKQQYPTWHAAQWAADRLAFRYRGERFDAYPCREGGALHFHVGHAKGSKVLVPFRLTI